MDTNEASKRNFLGVAWSRLHETWCCRDCANAGRKAPELFPSSQLERLPSTLGARSWLQHSHVASRPKCVNASHAAAAGRHPVHLVSGRPTLLLAPASKQTIGNQKF